MAEIFQKKAGLASSWRGQTQSSYHHGERRLDRVPEKGSVPLDDTRSQRSWRWGERTPFVLVTFLIAEMKYLRKATYRVCFCSQSGGIVPHGKGGTVAECQTVGHIVCPGREQKRLLLIHHSCFPFMTSRTHPWNGAVCIQGRPSLLT